MIDFTRKKIIHALIHLFKTKSAIRKITQIIWTCINLFIQSKKCNKKITQVICTCINSFIQNKKYNKNIIKNILYTFKYLLWLVASKIFCTHLIIYLKQKGNICLCRVTFIKKIFHWMIFFWWYHLFLCAKIVAEFLST